MAREAADSENSISSGGSTFWNEGCGGGGGGGLTTAMSSVNSSTSISTSSFWAGRISSAEVASSSPDNSASMSSWLLEATAEDEIRPAPAAAEPEPEPEADVFELTDDMAVASVAPPPPTSFHKIEPQDDLEFTESVASRAINRPPAYEPPAFDPPPAPAAGPILSQGTVSAVESAFNTLAHTVLSNNARTLEDLVKEMLRPMLKSWLDDNLPGLVERIVKAEIERVSRGR